MGKEKLIEHKADHCKLRKDMKEENERYERDITSCQQSIDGLKGKCEAAKF